MSEIKEMRTVPARTEERVTGYTCDLCGEKGASGVQDPNWTKEEFSADFETTTVSIRTGYSYPEDSSSSGRDYHICTRCFEGKLEPWLVAQGAEPTETNDRW